MVSDQDIHRLAWTLGINGLIITETRLFKYIENMGKALFVLFVR